MKIKANQLAAHLKNANLSMVFSLRTLLLSQNND
jgi:hypothetical protein